MLLEPTGTSDMGENLKHESMSMEQYNDMKKTHASKYLQAPARSQGEIDEAFNEAKHHISLRSSRAVSQRLTGRPEMPSTLEKDALNDRVNIQEKPKRKTYLQWLGEREIVSPSENIIPQTEEVVLKPAQEEVTQEEAEQSYKISYAFYIRSFFDHNAVVFWTIIFNVATVVLFMSIVLLFGCQGQNIIEMWSPSPNKNDLQTLCLDGSGRPLMRENTSSSASYNFTNIFLIKIFFK